MKQMFTLIAYDLRSQLRERGTIALVLVGLALAGSGLFEGARFEHHQRHAVTSASAQEVRARADAKALAQRYFADPAAPEMAALQWYRTPIDVRGYAFREHVGFAGKPAVPGAALAIGQADLLPAYVRVRAESMESARTMLEIEHPGRLSVGRFDLMFFVVYLWPLILLALCTSVLTQDRESHRLRALRLQGVNLGRMLAAQVTARAFAASALLILSTAAASLAAGVIPTDAAGCAALGAWAGVVLLYSMFWAAVTIVICAVCGNRMTAAFAGFGAWLMLAVLLPGAMTAAIQLGAPVPVREHYVEALRDAGDQVNADKLGSLARFYDSHPEWKPSATPLAKVSSSVSRLQRAQELERVMAGVERQFEQARLRQQNLFTHTVVFSPVTLAYQALTGIAGNDGARHQQFMTEVQRHQLRLRDYFQRAIQLAALGDEQLPCAATCLGGYGFRDFDQVPRFSASASLTRAPAAPTQLAALPVWIAALLALAAALMTRIRTS